MFYSWIITNVPPAKFETSWMVQELNKRAKSSPTPAITVAQLRERWKTTKGANKDRHMAGVSKVWSKIEQMNYLPYRIIWCPIWRL